MKNVFHLSFQFPSNGKADTKWCGCYLYVWGWCPVSIPFKREGGYKVEILTVFELFVIVSIPFKREGGYKDISSLTRRDSLTGFHSLQTGKHIARGCRCYKVYAKAGKMSNFFQRPLTTGRLHVGVYTALQGCRLARWRLPKVETLQGCRLARLQLKCQRLFRPNISKVKTRFLLKTAECGRFGDAFQVDRYYSTTLV